MGSPSLTSGGFPSLTSGFPSLTGHFGILCKHLKTQFFQNIMRYHKMWRFCFLVNQHSWFSGLDSALFTSPPSIFSTKIYNNIKKYCNGNSCSISALNSEEKVSLYTFSYSHKIMKICIVNNQSVKANPIRFSLY